MKLELARLEKRRCVLYVDHVQDDILQLSHAVTMSGFCGVLRVVASVAEAMEYLEGQGRFEDRYEFPEPDLIVSEANLRNERGNDLASRLHGRECYKQIPLVFFSRGFHPEEKKQAEALGVTAFVLKTDVPDLVKEQMSAVLKFFPMEACHSGPCAML